jgi:hypothetical protein
VAQALTSQHVRPPPERSPAEQRDLAGDGRQHSRDRQKRRRLAGAVGSEQRDDLAFGDVEVQAAHDGHAVVAGS